MNGRQILIIAGAGVGALLLYKRANAAINYNPDEVYYYEEILNIPYTNEQQALPAHGEDSIIDKVVELMANTTGATRGERNNNPGNIEKGQAWQGLSADQSGDARFAVFQTPEAGIRAMGKLLQNYQRNYGLNTVRGIINRWAPSVENNTSSYVNAVSAGMGVSPDAILDLNNPAVLQPLVREIIRHENGRVIYADNIIANGVSMVA